MKQTNRTTPLMMGVAAAALMASPAAAGRPERSGQTITPIFENGTYGELTMSAVSPDLTGETSGGADIEDVGDTYYGFGAAFKMDVDEQLSFGVIFDQPWGADITYEEDPLVAYSGARTEWNSNAITALGRYKLGNGVSVYGGIRAESLEIEIEVPIASVDHEIEKSTGFGYTVGAAYEVPARAARVSLTYHSEIAHEADVQSSGADNGDTTFSMPSSINLEARTAINPTTVIFGSMRYTDWKSLEIDVNGQPELVTYEDNTLQTSFGVGRAFSREWAGAVTVDYEPATDSPQSDLSPTDGKFGLGVAATYTMDDTKITGLVKFLSIGDAETSNSSDFQDNTTVAVGLKIARSF